MTQIGADGTRLYELSPLRVAHLCKASQKANYSNETMIIGLGRTSAMVRFVSEEEVVLAAVRLT